ncbi:hypothetical protein PVA17_25250, partial [Lysinibacillus sp. CNPSo 3705]|uniref:hypothetical protein n=1 Tax=Lysinibacillus sp. CNPSo 3705 TaxID=3028148 RepID=UPI0023647983
VYIFSHCEVFNDLIVEYLAFFIWHCDSTVVFRSIPLAFPQESSDASPNNAMYHTIILVTLSFIIKELM